MVKSTKKQPVTHGKPITAFFSKATKLPASSLSVPSSSQGTATSSKDTSSSKPRNDTNTRLIKGSVESADQSLAFVTPSLRSESSMSPKSNATLAESYSLKRARSPEAHLFSAPSTPKRLQVPRSTGVKKGIVSDHYQIDSVSYVKSTPNPQRKKKARVSSSEAPDRAESIQFVPSSQSDEELPIKKSHAVTTIVRDSPSTDGYSASLMNLDTPEDNVAGLPSTSGSWSPFNKTSSRQEGEPLNLPSTPPSSDLPSIPPTPVALDAASKTAKIIADIKARAFAKCLSSPESVPLEFNDLLESSSDEEDVLPVFSIVKKNATSVKPASFAKPEERPTRYPLRNRASVSPTRATRSRAIPSKMTVDKSPSQKLNLQARSRTKPTTTDPFVTLLKEKKAAAKRGHGTDAFHLAEITTSNVVRADFDDGSESGDEGDQAWKSATQAARNAHWLVDKPLTSETSRNGLSKLSLEDGDRKRLFGHDGGQAILDILERDKAGEKEAASSEKFSGMQIWLKAATNFAMQVDEHISPPQIPGRSPIIHLLNCSLKLDDLCRAAALLNTPLLMSVDVSQRPMVAGSLFSLLSSSGLDILVGHATRVLEIFWGSTMEPISSRISFPHVLNIFYRLGMEPSVLASQNWPSPVSVEFQDVDPLYRVKVVKSLIILVTACARFRRFQPGDIPDILLAILLLGMDSEASSELLQAVTLAVHQICQCIPLNDLDFETRLVSRLIGFVTALEPINKFRFLSFLSSGAGHTRRIANLVAHCIITDNAPTKDVLSRLLSLRDITEQLAPHSKSSGRPPGKFALHEETDYIDLGLYVSILAVAVSNVREYVVLERQDSKSKQLTSLHASPSKTGEKPKTDLQLLHLALETLHSHIADTRATHLERSRTKAIIKGLAMNVYYQREFWLKNDTEAKAKTLAQYFKKRDKL
ncbi:hypothetical protein CPB84DRAFT_1781409 [Gymnopilus junonius]|uniref:Uncharacterized protein n=1 Tax=Gymnopilus junonius TaxID=109634 RepID=A0A9P5NL24_GYMJU|nr:hypothetical protein CPB84DRAFT_1781409 [Gymnopilus junonius]